MTNAKYASVLELRQGSMQVKNYMRLSESGFLGEGHTVPDSTAAEGNKPLN